VFGDSGVKPHCTVAVPLPESSLASRCPIDSIYSTAFS